MKVCTIATNGRVPSHLLGVPKSLQVLYIQVSPVESEPRTSKSNECRGMLSYIHVREVTETEALYVLL